ncbi:MAG: hypothetical protein PHD97_12355 [Bacteroidales bacterium]|nr:hypothetical protein [Bacteroidales bacterium]
MKIQRICAWCKDKMGEIEVECDDEYGCITHGICKDCLKKQQEKVKKYKEKLNETKTI